MTHDQIAQLQTPQLLSDTIRTSCGAQNVALSGPNKPADRWQHRHLNMRCGTCMWWSAKSPDLGRCRRHAPTLSGFPAVFRDDWCGDHKIDELKV